MSRTLLAFGITTVRDTSGGRTSYDLRERLASGDVLGPRLLASGILIDSPNSFWSFARVVANESEMRAEVRLQAAEGADMIKIFNGLPPELLTVAIDEAGKHGLPVIGHLGRTGWTEAARAGIRGLLHSCMSGPTWELVHPNQQEAFRNFFSFYKGFDPTLFGAWREAVDLDGPELEALIAALVRNRVEVNPNLVHMEAIISGDDAAVRERLEPDYAPDAQAKEWRETERNPYSADWSPHVLKEAKETWPKFIAIIQRMHEAGVLLTAGSDLGNPWMTPGVSLHRDLELLEQAGIPPSEVLRIATANGAEALGIMHKTGTVAPGKRADLVVLTADPLEDIGNTRKIERVFLNGQAFEPEELLKQR